MENEWLKGLGQRVKRGKKARECEEARKKSTRMEGGEEE